MNDRLTRQQETIIRSLRTRHGRKDFPSYTVCEGLRASSEVVSLRPDLVRAIIFRESVNESFQTCPIVPVVLSEQDFSSLADTVNSQGIMVLSEKPVPPVKDSPPADKFVLILDRVMDPGNMGTIIRTARAAGLKEVWITKGSTDPYSPKAVRSASGAQFAVSVREFDSMDELVSVLVKHGYKTIYRTEPSGGADVFKEEKLFEYSCIVLGGEANGAVEIPSSVSLNIPMPGSAESLNVAQAATIVLFEFVRRSRL